MAANSTPLDEGAGGPATPIQQSLVDLIDVPALQSMMDDFYTMTSIPTALIDVDGRVIVGSGWQRACTTFHRINAETRAACIESDTALTADIPIGEARLYKCKNGLWDAAMPVTVHGERVANMFIGQFFFDDEQVDLDFFAQQAGRYGFPKETYLEAIQAVPRFSRKTVDHGLRFLTSLANMLSQLTVTNFELEALVGEHRSLLRREREQSDRLRTIAEIESVLTSSLDFGEVVTRALKSAETHLRVVASSVWTLDAQRRRLCLVGSRGFSDEFAGEFADGLSLDGQFPVARAAREAAPIIFDDVATARLHAPVAEAYARHGIQLRGLVALPLVARNEVIGSMTLAWEQPRKFSADDLTLVDTLASRFSVAMENARLFQAEHMIAETLQETLVVLPAHVPGVTYSRSYESATYESGRVGGDFVDVFHIDGPVVGITLGDVSGKGLGAAVTTSLIRTTLRAHALDGVPPAVVAEKANRMMRRFSETEAFVTLWFGLLDTVTGHLRYVCAGHPPALILGQTQGLTPLECRDPILGAFDTAQFYESQTMLAAGDRLLLYTDGVTEARTLDGQFLGNEGLEAVVARHQTAATARLSDEIMREVVAYSDGVLRDDAAILVIEPTPKNEA